MDIWINKLKPTLVILLVGVLALASCNDDSTPGPDTIGYKIVNNSAMAPTVFIEYTDENGTNTMVSNPGLPWEISFNPNFAKPRLLTLEASCDCEMTAQISLNGVVVNDSTNSMLTIEYTYR